MKSSKLIFATVVVTLIMTVSLAAAQPKHNSDASKGVPAMDQQGARKYGIMARLGVSPEKQEAIKKIHDEYKDKFFSLDQDLRAKHAELNAIMLQAQPDTDKAKETSKALAALIAQRVDIAIDMHARIAKETGVRLPLGMGMSMGMGTGMGMSMGMDVGNGMGMNMNKFVSPTNGKAPVKK